MRTEDFALSPFVVFSCTPPLPARLPWAAPSPQCEAAARTIPRRARRETMERREPLRTVPLPLVEGRARQAATPRTSSPFPREARQSSPAGLPAAPDKRAGWERGAPVRTKQQQGQLLSLRRGRQPLRAGVRLPAPQGVPAGLSRRFNPGAGERREGPSSPRIRRGGESRCSALLGPPSCALQRRAAAASRSPRFLPLLFPFVCGRGARALFGAAVACLEKSPRRRQTCLRPR